MLNLTHYTIVNEIGLTQEVPAFNPRDTRAHSLL
jgi:hypothetical protein